MIKLINLLMSGYLNSIFIIKLIRSKKQLIKPNKSQGMIEFMILFGAVLFFFVAFMLAIQTSSEEKTLEKQNVYAQNIALSVQNELALAAQASDGYSREFYVTNTILGDDYEITLVDNSVYIKAEKIALSYSVVVVDGNIQKGLNTIKKEGGVVYLNG